MIVGLDLSVFADALEFVVDERRLILEKTWEHLELSAAAMAIAVVLALPIGAWLGHLHRGEEVVGATMDFSKLLNRAQELQDRMQQELATLVVEASAGGGMVKVKMNGMKQLLAVEIDREAVDPDDVPTLQTLVLSAVNEASRQVDATLKERIGTMTGGLQGLLGL